MGVVVVVVVVVIDISNVADAEDEVASRHIALLATAHADVHDDTVLALDVVVGQGAVVQQRIFPHNKELLFDRDALLLLEHRLHDFDRQRRHHIQSDGLTAKLHEDLNFPAIDHMQ